jgi:folate-binding protein YgfZ
MSALPLHELHAHLGARFAELNGMELVADYGDPHAEYTALRAAAGVIDLSFRGRICLTGGDRVRLLHGQVTNDVQALRTGQGCHAAMVSAKGRMQADLRIYALAQELLLDFEPGQTAALQQRFDHYIVADDVQVIDVAPYYGLLSVQGPRAWDCIAQLEMDLPRPQRPGDISHLADPAIGDLYLACHSRLGPGGFDLFVPSAALGMVHDKLLLAASHIGGVPTGWTAMEWTRIESGIPRFGADMDETNLPPEAGLDRDAISYSKGCYIGQEIIARLRTYGQVTKALRGLSLPPGLETLPARGDKLLQGARDVGYVTSACLSPVLQAPIALGYVRKECNQPGTALTLRTAAGEVPVTVATLPFVASDGPVAQPG